MKGEPSGVSKKNTITGADAVPKAAKGVARRVGTGVVPNPEGRRNPGETSVARIPKGKMVKRKKKSPSLALHSPRVALVNQVAAGVMTEGEMIATGGPRDREGPRVVVTLKAVVTPKVVVTPKAVAVLKVRRRAVRHRVSPDLSKEEARGKVSQARGPRRGVQSPPSRVVANPMGDLLPLLHRDHNPLRSLKAKDFFIYR